MKAIFNDEILEFDDIKFSPEDRGFRYGDGLFETIAVVNGIPRLLNKHYQRIARGAELLGYDLGELTFERLEEKCLELVKYNHLYPFGKIRLSLWRKGSGLYEPMDQDIYYLLVAQPVEYHHDNTLKKVDFSERVINYPTKISGFKTISALKYVLAGLEKKEKQLDEIIINDHHGFVSETLYSNLFIKTKGIYVTPPITGGCVDGIMRRWLIEQLRSRQKTIHERFFKEEELLKADSVFTTNAMGIKHVLKIRNIEFAKDNAVQKMILSIS